MAVLDAPVYADHHKIGLLPGRPHLLLHDILLAGVDDVCGHLAVPGDAVGVLGVGEVRDLYAVHGLDGDAAIVRLALPQAGGDHILGHRLPEPEGGGNARSPLVVGVIVREAEHPETCPVKRFGALTGSREARIGRGRKLFAAERLLIDPVDVLLCIKIKQIRVAVIEAVSFALCSPPGGLRIDGRMDEVVPCSREAQCRDDRLRLRNNKLLRNSRGLRLRCRRNCIHDAAGPEAQREQRRYGHQQDPQCVQGDALMRGVLLGGTPTAGRGCVLCVLGHRLVS